MGLKSYYEIIIETFIGNYNSSIRARLIKPDYLFLFNDPLSYAFG
jgi:hypothetical protein